VRASTASPVSRRRSRPAQPEPELGAPLDAVAVIRDNHVDLAACDKQAFRRSAEWLRGRDLPAACLVVVLFPAELRPWGFPVCLRRTPRALHDLIAAMRCFGVIER
jgi:hypothetical protein